MICIYAVAQLRGLPAIMRPPIATDTRRRQMCAFPLIVISAAAQVCNGSKVHMMASKSQKGRWSGMDAGRDSSDDQVAHMSSLMVLLHSKLWQHGSRDEPCVRPLALQLILSRLRCLTPQHAAMNHAPASSRAHAGHSMPLAPLHAIGVHNSPPATAAATAAAADAPLVCFSPQQDISRGRGMIDSLFQGGAGQGGTQNAILSSEEYLSQAQRHLNNIEVRLNLRLSIYQPSSISLFDQPVGILAAGEGSA